MTKERFMGFEFDGVWIEDPSLCELGMDDVDPRAYYGIDLVQDEDGVWYWAN
jgi:hypothetical protein